jgi:putative redox protein
MPEVLVTTTNDRFAQDIQIRGHRLRGDEQVDKGGNDRGPEPHELLLAALGTCTSMTMRAYSDRKGWPLGAVSVRLTGQTIEGKFVIAKSITMTGNLDDEQRRRLLEIADKCPVHRTLSNPIVIDTREA